MSVWSGLNVAVVGGDLRETEIAQIAAAHGSMVKAFGCPPPPPGSPIEMADSLEDVFRNTQIAILPVPLIASDGSIYAPHASRPIVITGDLLSLMGTQPQVITGRADQPLQAAASASGVQLHEYEGDTDLMLLRAPAIAEGAIKVAIERSPVTIHGSDIGVSGFGRIAAALTRALVALNSQVHVFARRAEARAAAYALGAASHEFAEIPEVFPRLQVLYNSVPSRIITRDELSHLQSGRLVVDLAAPPGGIDLDAARELGLDPLWARGLGASAPRTVALSQWTGIDRIVSRSLGGPASDKIHLH